jgi:hypothetical protein
MNIDERIELLKQSIKSHDRSIRELASQVSDLTQAIAGLPAMRSRNAAAIETLARKCGVDENR